MSDDLIAAVRRAGVVGAGGAGFPTHLKINAKVDVVIANGAECEPLLRAHQHIMAEESEKMLLGMKLVMAVTGAQKGYIGLKAKYKEAVANLQQALQKTDKQLIEIFFLPDIYPSGDEHVLVHEITGRIVPEGGIPLHTGVVVANVETLVNVANAVKNISVTHKYVTVGGAVKAPVTLKVPVGTPVSELIKEAGGVVVQPYSIIDGGPMMGKIISDDAVVTKTTGGILVFAENHFLIQGKKTPWRQLSNRAKAVCCNCRACTDVCPRNLLGHGLEPHRIMQSIGYGQDVTHLSRVFMCSECGACEVFGCSMGLSPRAINAELKREFAKAGIKNPHHDKPVGVRSNRNFRLVPTKRLLARLGISQYDVEAPLRLEEISVKKVRIPLSQHIGAPAQAIVKVGDMVSKGDLIAAIPEGANVGANIHASIDGKVTDVEKYITISAV